MFTLVNSSQGVVSLLKIPYLYMKYKTYLLQLDILLTVLDVQIIATKYHLLTFNSKKTAYLKILRTQENCSYVELVGDE